MNILNHRQRPYPFAPKNCNKFGAQSYDYTIMENAVPIAMGRKARRLVEKLERKQNNKKTKRRGVWNFY